MGYNKYIKISKAHIKLGKHFTTVMTMIYSVLCVFHILSCSSEAVETIFLFKTA